MAVLRVFNGKGKYRDIQTIPTLIDYITDEQKTPSGYIGGAHIDPDEPAESMLNVRDQFGKSNGVQAYHFSISFAPFEHVDTGTAYCIADMIAYGIGTKYQCVYAVHETTKILHIHFLFNTVSHVNGERFTGRYQEYCWLKNRLCEILRHFGIRYLQYSTDGRQEENDTLSDAFI